MFKWIRGEYTTSCSADFSDDSVVMFWEYESKSKQNSKLPHLALTILSIVVNTATCERLFSELALIQTLKRNRMTIEKTMKHQVMRQYVREKIAIPRLPPRAISTGTSIETVWRINSLIQKKTIQIFRKKNG
ncbi:hypothetical protein F443_01068 [Phytophthora nicotianae P1569]|uniref:HAT C-terminal dimerisation domain-containing protein n=1 Tax=Phytophthora nicotianae P1569 TaxID=1317065 RepID=V9G181_PHYNI|nr:hypothetical protein F443_01068 [Phytophthora nicotianae P1569]